MKDRDLLFGTLAIRRGYVTSEQVAACIRDQAKSAGEGRTLRLGQIMVRNNCISAAQFMELLEEQEQQILECTGCGKRYNVRKYEGGRKVRCKGCGTILTVPSDLDAIVGGELIDIGTVHTTESQHGTGHESGNPEEGTSRERRSSRSKEATKTRRRRRSTMAGPLGASESVPDAFAGYPIKGEIGRGGMGRVFRVHDARRDKDVALKVVRPDGHSSDIGARFKREIAALQTLRHPAIVEIYDVGVFDGVPWYTMELIDGRDLAELIKDGTPRRRLVELLGTVAQALEVAHRRRIIHRDIKPSNILVDRTGEPRLTDFGLARDLNVEEALTRPGQIVGTPYYMAPEQILGDENAIGPRSDVYALGILLYQILTGVLPHAASSVIQLYSQVLEEVPRPPTELADGIEPALERIVMKAIDKDPTRRYGSAGEFAAALAAADVPPAVDDDHDDDEPAPKTKRRRASPTHRIRQSLKLPRLAFEIRGGRAVHLMLTLGMVAAFAAGLGLGRWTAPGGGPRADDLLHAGEASLSSGAYAEARTYFEQAIALEEAGAAPRATELQLARSGLARAQLAAAALAVTRAIEADRADDAAAGLAAFWTRRDATRAGATLDQLPLLARLELTTRPAGVPVGLHPVGQPGRTVAAQGLAIGVTPVQLRLPRGHYQLRLGRPGRDVWLPLDLDRDRRLTLTLPESAALTLVPASDAEGGPPAFLIGRTEVTVKAYYEFLKTLPADQRRRRAPRVGGRRGRVTPPRAGLARPVRGIRWVDAQAYALWAGGRLPTVAEWRRAYGADDSRTQPWGRTPPFTPLKALADVGQPPHDRSPFGVAGMAGGVAEWLGVPDREGQAMVAGGSWRRLPPALIHRRPADQTDDAVGLRIARSLLPSSHVGPAGLAAAAASPDPGVQIEALRRLALGHPSALETARVLLDLIGRPAPVADAARHHLASLDPRQLAQALGALIRSGDQPEATQIRHWLRQKGDDAVHALLLLVTYHAELGEAALEALLDARGEEAAAALERCLPRLPEVVRADVKRSLQVSQVRYFRAARDESARGAKADRARVLALLGRTLALDPRLKEALWLRIQTRSLGQRGRPYGDGADLDGTLADIKRLLTLDPGFVKARYIRAEIQRRRDQFEAAEAEVRMIARTHGDDPKLLLLRGRLWMDQKRYAEAEAALAEAVNRLDGASDRRTAGLQLALARAHLGKHDAAQSGVRRLIKDNPGNAACQLQLALVLQIAGKQTEAVGVLRSLLENPGLSDGERKIVRLLLRKLNGGR